MIGPIADAFVLLIVTLLTLSFLVIPGLSAASTSKNLGGFVLLLTLVGAWVWVISAHLSRKDRS